MTRMRTKRRGYHQSRCKQDGITLSLDLCPHCYSFLCDPTAMSIKFSNKISDRLRQKRCPSCGKPKDFCSCKSTMSKTPILVPGHNNKKLRRMEEIIRKREQAAMTWTRLENEIQKRLPENIDVDDIGYALRHHNIPNVDWMQVKPTLDDLHITDICIIGWQKSAHPEANLN